MGLDQFLVAQKGEAVEQIGLWRKHANLQGYMEQLALKRGVVDDIKEFSCVDLPLNLQDILDVKKVIGEDMLPYTTGFFYGKSNCDDAEKNQDLLIFDEAESYCLMGWNIAYSAWW
tara:strand:- start:476 stop:823 length:348 start_codon:yes stop_codon:yes gene_type:complete